jgi:hypothetical protein
MLISVEYEGIKKTRHKTDPAGRTTIALNLEK